MTNPNYHEFTEKITGFTICINLQEVLYLEDCHGGEGCCVGLPGKYINLDDSYATVRDLLDAL